MALTDEGMGTTMLMQPPVKDVMSVIDELISVLSAIQPRLYNGVMRKLQEI